MTLLKHLSKVRGGDGGGQIQIVDDDRSPSKYTVTQSKYKERTQV